MAAAIEARALEAIVVDEGTSKPVEGEVTGVVIEEEASVVAAAAGLVVVEVEVNRLRWHHMVVLRAVSTCKCLPSSIFAVADGVEVMDKTSPHQMQISPRERTLLYNKRKAR